MQRTSFAQRDCPIAQALDVVGDWWTLLILRNAFNGQRRFEEMQAHLGIARNMLSRRLKALVAAGVLEERAYQERPRRVEYRLTAKGRDLYPVIVALFRWGRHWSDKPEVRELGLVHRDTGEPADPQLMCARRGTVLDPRGMRLARGGKPVDLGSWKG